MKIISHNETKTKLKGTLGTARSKNLPLLVSLSAVFCAGFTEAVIPRNAELTNLCL